MGIVSPSHLQPLSRVAIVSPCCSAYELTECRPLSELGITCGVYTLATIRSWAVHGTSSCIMSREGLGSVQAERRMQPTTISKHDIPLKRGARTNAVCDLICDLI
jgi:hypothetical protein